MYNWQLPDWPQFSFNEQELEDALFAFAQQTGHVSGLLKAMPGDTRMEAIIDTMVAEAIKTSEIEGEHLNRNDVMSSIRNNLGLNKTLDNVKDKKAKGAGELMVDVRKTYKEPLTEEKLFQWHKMLLETTPDMITGAWRTHADAMQIISGPIGKRKVHFEAPPSARVPKEMKQFIKWFNDTAPGGKKEIKKAPVRSTIAHLYFESIHPFEDGNGRIGRALAEKALSQTLGGPVLLSLSRTIEKERKVYYNALQKAQMHNEITPWMKYFVSTVLKAQVQAKNMVSFTLKKAKFFDGIKDNLNERQLKVIKKMLDAGPEGFTGGINAEKYGSINKTSKATATRDLQVLKEMDVLLVEGGGRSTRYVVNV